MEGHSGTYIHPKNIKKRVRIPASVLIVEIHSNDLICIVVSMEDKYMKAKLI
jgi:hypothetical protein